MIGSSIKNPYQTLGSIICFSILAVSCVYGEGIIKQDTLRAKNWEKIYSNDFSTTTLGEQPEGMFVLAGEFSVMERESNAVLILPGEPLGDFGILFGLRQQDNVAVRARISSDSRGRRKPAFSIGLNGRSGYRLRVNAAARAVQLLKGDRVYSEANFEWVPNTWIWLDLQIEKTDDKLWVITGKAWLGNSLEPAVATVRIEDNKIPAKGRASVWGTPYSGKAILFDDLGIYVKKDDKYRSCWRGANLRIKSSSLVSLRGRQSADRGNPGESL